MLLDDAFLLTLICAEGYCVPRVVSNDNSDNVHFVASWDFSPLAQVSKEVPLILRQLLVNLRQAFKVGLVLNIFKVPRST